MSGSTLDVGTAEFYGRIAAAIEGSFSPFIRGAIPDVSFTLFDAVRRAHEIDVKDGGVVAYANHHDLRASVAATMDSLEWAFHQVTGGTGVEGWGLSSDRTAEELLAVIELAPNAPAAGEPKPRPLPRPDTGMLGYGKYRAAIMTVIAQIGTRDGRNVGTVIDALIDRHPGGATDVELLAELERQVDLQHPVGEPQQADSRSISKAAPKWLSGRSRNMLAYFHDVAQRAGSWQQLSRPLSETLTALDRAIADDPNGT